MVLTETGLAKVFQRIKSFIASQLNSKASAIHTHTKSEITDFPTNYVTTDSTQTIAGVKTFSNNIYTLGQQIIIKNNNVERTVLPASTVYMSFAFSDKDSVGVASRFSAIENVILPNGDINLDLRAYDFSSKTNAKTTVVLERKYDGTSNFYPEINNGVNLGTSTAQWNNAYIKSLTINGVACGDILTHNVSEFVNVTGAQTIGGVKTFSNEVTMFGRDINLMSRLHYGKNSNPSANTWQYLYFRGNTATEGYTNAWYSGYIEQYVDITGPARGRWLVRDTSENAVSIDLYVDGNNKQVRPTSKNDIELGTSTNKWKSFNGINPGALSLPSNSYVNVDTTNWDLTCQNDLLGSFTPTADGWLMLHVANSGTSEVNFWVIGGVIRINNKSTLNTSDNNNFNMITIPVEKDVTYNIYGNASEYVAGRSIRYCRFMPCRGNV